MTDWRDRAAARKDFRHTKGPDDPPTQPAKKDRKRWCGGHVGREHEPVCLPHTKFKLKGTEKWRDLSCKVCGKLLDHYWPMTWDKIPPPPPPWVTS